MTMSQPSFEAETPVGIQVAKPRTSIYTVLLIISLLALMLGCLLLYLEIGEYGGLGNIKGQASLSQPMDAQGAFGTQSSWMV